MTILCLCWSVAAFARGEYLTVIVVLMFAYASVGFVLTLITIKRGRVLVRGEFDKKGTVVRPDRTFELISLSTIVAGIAGMGMYTIFAPLGMMDIPTPGLGQFYYVALGAVGVVVGVAVLQRIRARGGVSYLRLTPSGFDLEEGLSSAHGKWDDVAQVTDRSPRGPRPVRGTIAIVTSDGKSAVLTADSYTPGGHALREMVRFYWQHPEHRAELTDGRGLERLRSEAFEN